MVVRNVESVRGEGSMGVRKEERGREKGLERYSILGDYNLQQSITCLQRVRREEFRVSQHKEMIDY